MSDKKDVVWEKAKIIEGKDPKKYRLDPYGKEIYYNSYGNLQTKDGRLIILCQNKKEGKILRKIYKH